MRSDLLVNITGDAQLDPHTLVASQYLAEQLDLTATKSIALQVGQSSLSMSIKINAKQPAASFKMHPNLMNKMGLQNPMRYAVIKSSQRVRIGPLIGVAANLKPDIKRPFGGQSFFIRQLISQAQEMGAICFAFSGNDFHFKQAQIRGYTYHNNDWKTALYPIPDVIYPRCSNSGFNRHMLRAKLSKMGVRFINPPGLGKWATYNTVAKNSALLTYLPETRLLNQFQELEGMLKKYRHVYMKPVTGSQGKKIIRVSKNIIAKAYEYQYQHDQHPVKSKAYSLGDLERSLKIIMGRDRYIVQQQINLLRSGASIMDLRVMVQKGRKGDWLLTGKVFRIGKTGSITSNISGGGSASKVKDQLNRKFNDSKEVQRIMDEVDFLALETARTIEKRLGPIGELGIDIGVDQNARIWLIEANLMPARKIFSLIGDTEARLLSVQRPILYALYLAGF